MITQELALEHFEYKDGNLYWKKHRKTTMIGTLAGCESRKYWYVELKGKKYMLHRVVFLMFYGKLSQVIDHIDGNPSNNKIENLRLATQQQNCYNSVLRKNNTSGIKGVNWHKLRSKWKVEIRIGGKKQHFGLFKDIELAELVAQEARNKYHKEFKNHGNFYII
jgi:hypothetical protein